MKLEYLRPGHCPICNELIPQPAIVYISFNDKSVMQQPVCNNHFETMLQYETQLELLNLCKTFWIKEIEEGIERTDEEKQKEVERINNLEVMFEK